MKVIPSFPPGRSSRKALAFADDIARLLAGGYSGEAIRRALAEAGVAISKTTMKREVARARARIAHGESAHTGIRRDTSMHLPLNVPPVLPSANAARLSGREIADDFVRGRINHPLLRQGNKP